MFFSDWVGGSPLTAASCDVAGLVPAAIRYRGIYSFHWSPGGSPLMRQNQNIHCILSSLLFLQRTRGAGHDPPLGDNNSSKDLYVVDGWDGHLGDGQCRGPSGGGGKSLLLLTAASWGLKEAAPPGTTHRRCCRWLGTSRSCWRFVCYP